MLDLGPALDALRVAHQQITFLFEKVIAENAEGFREFLVRIVSAPQILDCRHLYVTPEADSRDELDHILEVDI